MIKGKKNDLSNKTTKNQFILSWFYGDWKKFSNSLRHKTASHLYIYKEHECGAYTPYFEDLPRVIKLFTIKFSYHGLSLSMLDIN